MDNPLISNIKLIWIFRHPPNFCTVKTQDHHFIEKVYSTLSTASFGIFIQVHHTNAILEKNIGNLKVINIFNYFLIIFMISCNF